MIKQKIEKIIADAAKVLPEDMHQLKHELEHSLRATLNATFAKMDLVTREEFDIQTRLLQRTRAQLDVLNKKTLALEEKLQQEKV